MNTVQLQTHTAISLAFTHTVVSPASWAQLAREANYRPQGIAQLCCVSYRTVQRHFRKHYQTTFTEWLNQHRMDEARRRILTGASMKEVCFELGYKQPSHFTRVFKKYYGMPPSQLATSQQRRMPVPPVKLPLTPFFPPLDHAAGIHQVSRM
ncbi:MAG TPA: helix-turn-helix transcriptional regulator [Verrucomicrobiae bacterium]